MSEQKKRLLRWPEALRRTGDSRSKAYEEVRAGRYPKPVPLYPGGRAVGLPEDEIDQLIADRIARRDDPRRGRKGESGNLSSEIPRELGDTGRRLR
jgi:prophage regulatory protein